MRIIKKTVSSVLVLIMVLSLTACGGTDITGTWSAEQNGISVVYKFDKDGKGTLGMSGINVDMTYKTEGSNLIVDVNVAGQPSSETYVYSISGDKLTLSSNGTSVEFTKQ